METLELFGARDRKGKLRIFTGDAVIKNPGRGYWLSECNAELGELEIDRNSFPEIQWDDSRPTKLLLINPESEDDLNDDVSIPGCIEVCVDNPASECNIRTDSPITVFINNISYIEPREGERHKSSIHLKDGTVLTCIESVNEIKRLINENS